MGISNKMPILLFECMCCAAFCRRVPGWRNAKNVTGPAELGGRKMEHCDILLRKYSHRLALG